MKKISAQSLNANPLNMKALEMAWETRGKPSRVMFHSDPGQSLYELAVKAVTVAIPDQAEYEPTWKLPG